MHQRRELQVTQIKHSSANLTNMNTYSANLSKWQKCSATLGLKSFWQLHRSLCHSVALSVSQSVSWSAGRSTSGKKRAWQWPVIKRHITSTWINVTWLRFSKSTHTYTHPHTHTHTHTQFHWSWLAPPLHFSVAAIQNSLTVCHLVEGNTADIIFYFFTFSLSKYTVKKRFHI